MDNTVNLPKYFFLFVRCRCVYFLLFAKFHFTFRVEWAARWTLANALRPNNVKISSAEQVFRIAKWNESIDREKRLKSQWPLPTIAIQFKPSIEQNGTHCTIRAQKCWHIHFDLFTVSVVVWHFLFGLFSGIFSNGKILSCISEGKKVTDKSIESKSYKSK